MSYVVATFAVLLCCEPVAGRAHPYIDVVISDCRDFLPSMMHQIAESPALFGGPMHIGMKHRAFVYHKCGELPEWDDFKLKDERGWRVAHTPQRRK